MSLVTVKGFTLRDYQQQAVMDCAEYLADDSTYKKVLAVLPTGCHGKGHPILLYSGETKPVEEITQDDILMGNDSMPRNINYLIRGTGELYRITTTSDLEFVVNEDHILYLERTSLNSEKADKKYNSYSEVVCISVKEYLLWSKSRKHIYKLKRVPVHYGIHNELKIDPYYLGLWLSDGDSNSTIITKEDHEIISYIEWYASNLGLDFNKLSRGNRFSITSVPGTNNPLRDCLAYYSLLNNKHIPMEYKTASYENRMNLLSGILDGDGYFDASKNIYEVTFKSKKLAEDLSYLCNSLGYFNKLKPKKVTCNNCPNIDENYEAWRILISADDKIKCRVERKKCRERRQKKDVSKCGFSIQHIGEGEYFGFNLDSNQLYLDGNFMVHHNSGKSLIISSVANLIDTPVLVLQPSKELLKQNFEKFVSMGGEAGIFSASLKSKDIQHITFATPGSMVKAVDDLKKLRVKHVFIDECLHPDSKIITEEGNIRIRILHDKIKRGLSVPKVLSLNEELRKFEYKEIIGAKKVENKELLHIELSPSGVIKCSPNHKLLTTCGWVFAGELKPGDAVVQSFSPLTKSTIYSVLTPDQHSLVLGSIVGDGSLDSRNNTANNARLKFIHGEAQYPYIEWKSKMLPGNGEIRIVEKNGFSGKKAFTFTTSTFYFEEYKKSLEYVVNNLDEKALAVLWMDDGNLGKGQSTGSLYTLCHEPALISKLGDKLRYFGITDFEIAEGKSSSTNRKLNYIRFRKDGLIQLNKVISPFIHPSMTYKVMDGFRHLVGTYVWDIVQDTTVKVVKKINKQEGLHTLYDLEVLDNHNFVVGKSDSKRNKGENGGSVVHNCHLASKPGSQVSSIIKGLGDKIKVIGFTATPILLRNSLNGAELAMLNKTKDSIFSDIIHVTQIKQLVDKDYWAKLKYKVYKQDKSSLTENSNGSDFTDESIIQYYEDNRLEDKIVKLIDEDLCESRNSILIFVPSIEAAEKLSRIIPGSAYVHSKMDPSHRDIVIKNFKNGSIQVCINVNVLSVGFDHPALDCIIETAPTMSMARYYQKVGRAVRPHHSKEDALIIDFSGNYDRFGGVENLTFENLEGYGWGMFQGEYLLSGHPVKAKKLKKSQISKPLDKLVKQKIWFGIHKGSELIELPEDYIKWMLHQSGWDFKGEKMKDLKLGLEKILAM